MKIFNIHFKAAETPVNAFSINGRVNVSKLIENASTGLITPNTSVKN